jgi:SNF2 family DNA or RNA helicase
MSLGKTFNNHKSGQVGEFLKENVNNGANVDMVSSIFTLYAFDKLKKQLNQTSTVRLLYNEPTFLDNFSFVDKDSKVFVLEMKNRERNMSEFDLEIALKNKLNQPTVAQEFYNFIQDKVSVKSVTNKNVINHKYIQVKNRNEKNYLLDGANLDFSLEGLGYKNRIMFDFKKYEDDPAIIREFSKFFDEIWHNKDVTKDVKENMLEHLTTLYKENAPELIYYLTLYHMFKDILINQDDYTRIKEKTGIHNSKIWNMLYNFQQDAAVGAIKKIETYNGCIIADSVGLGKTFEALAIIKYYELRNDRVLVLSPKKLRSNWTSFKQNSTSNMLAEDRFNYDVLNHTDLSRDGGYSGDIDLNTINWGNYDLLVIDESHNFRNAPAVKDRITRYDKLMDWIIKSGVKTKVLMLSATPVNNRLADLKNQIRFITEDNDHALAESTNIESVERTLTNAQRRFNEWGEIPDNMRTTDALLQMLDYDFFNLLNSLTIARSRKHIQKYYDTKDIGEFPKRLTPITIKSNIDALEEFPSLSSVNGDIAKLTLPIYSPMLYLLPTRVAEYEEKYGQTVKGGTSSFTQTDRERSLVNLMRVNILKRLESSIDAFRLTIGRVLNQINDALQKIENHKSFDYDSINDADDEWEDVEVGKKITVLLKDMDRIRYKNDLLDDKAILETLLNESYKVTVDRDKKLLDLKQQISNKIKNPINPNNKKMIIFTSFSDTAEYLYKNISDWVKENFNVNSGLVTGSSTLKNNAPNVRNHFEDILIHFSPESSKYKVKNGSIDILIATDCISEGQNLQDCDYLVNYDIHWNPVRIIQRFGRIDRIGSKNKVIQLVNFWPNMELDEYINLESRVKNRMALLDLSATGEDDVLSTEGKDLAYRKEQLKKLQEEVVDLEDISGGISITDFTLDDFIISLEKYMKDHPNMLEDYPTGIHAVTNIPNQIKDEAVEGVIYCLKQMNYDANEKAANSLYPFFLVYVKQNGEIHISNKSPKRTLDLYKSMTTGKSDVIKEVAESFNKETKDGTKMDVYTELLDKAVFDIKGIVEEKGIQSLFRLGRSTIKSNQVKGVNDFELVSFLVIKDE